MKMTQIKYPLSLKDCFLFFFCLILPIFWILAILFIDKPVLAKRRTDTSLKNTDTMIQNYAEMYGETPQNLSEIRAFTKAHGFSSQTFDVYGERFQYIRLDRQNYILRSFGVDGLQNTLLRDRDLGLFKVKGKKTKGNGLMHRFGTVETVRFYPASLLLGAISPNQTWLARVFVDRKRNTKQLIVQHREKKDFFLVAPHDSVEEFLWHPDGHTIIFSATSSNRYKDGIYLWNLIDDSLINILDTATFRMQLDELSKEGLVYASLAGIDVEGPKLFAYVAPRTTTTLNPNLFFSPKHLLSFELLESGRKPVIKTMATNSKPFPSPLIGLLKPNTLIFTGSDGTREQRQWLQLSFEGPMESVITEWQKMSEYLSETPLFPYSLWYFSILYSEAYQIAKVPHQDTKTKNNPMKSPEQVEIVRSYATELSGALMKLPTAPSYLRGLGAYAFEKLTNNETLPYQFARFDPESHDILLK